MKVFVYEHITGGGALGRPVDDALLPEAMLMLEALASDLHAARAKVTALRDHRLDLRRVTARLHPVSSAIETDAAFDRLARAADAVWIVAPESGGVLERLSRRVLDLGRPMLGSSVEAVRLAASKLATVQALRRAGIPAVSTFRWDEAPAGCAGAWVAKPDDGCGCEDTRIFADLPAARAWIEAQSEPGRFVVQPYVPGEPLSLSVLGGDGKARLLSVNRQRISARDERLVFLGSEVNATTDSDGSLQRVAQGVLDALPGLWGYFGIDLISASSGPVVLEVNPRLTTSYAGLHGATGVNPARLVLAMLDRSALPLVPSSSGRAVLVDVRAQTRTQLPAAERRTGAPQS